MTSYNKTAYMGNPQLSFPAVADSFRELGSAYFVGRMPSGYNAEIGQDIYGWGADARRMAYAKVQSTRTAQRLYDRTPRYRVEPTGLAAIVPFGVNHTRDTFPARLMGAGSIGALTTPEGQEYRRKILDARAEQLRAMEQDPPVEAAPPSMKELTEKDALKEQYALEFKAIENEFAAGVAERSQANDLSKWVSKFLGLLPYYDRNDLDELVGYQRRIDSMMEDMRDQIGAVQRGEDAEKREAVYEFMLRVFRTWDTVISKYLGQERDIQLPSVTILRGQRELTTVSPRDQFGQEAIINLPLNQRIAAVKAILRELGLARQVNVLPPNEEDIAADAVEDEEANADEFADNEDAGGEVVAEGGDEEADAAAVEERPRTQAQITAEVNRRVADGEAEDVAEAIRQVAADWEDVTGYRPTATATYKSVRQTLVQRIKAAQRVAGRGLSGGVKTRMDVRAKGDGFEVFHTKTKETIASFPTQKEARRYIQSIAHPPSARAQRRLADPEVQQRADAYRSAKASAESVLKGEGRLLRGRSSQAVTYPIHAAKEQARQLVKARQ